MIITFAGHREVENAEQVRLWLYDTIKQQIERGAKTFYLGGYGEWDRMAASIIQTMKKEYSFIESVFVTPYLDRTIPCSYDTSIYPPLEKVPKRLAILKRNEWMVDHADVLIAYVTRNFGGAYKMLTYAKRKKKEVILYPD